MPRSSTANKQADTVTEQASSVEEAEPRGPEDALDPGEPAVNPSCFLPWVTVGSASASIDASTQPFKTNPNSLKLETTGAGGAIRNPGYWGINAQAGANFTVSFYAWRSTGTVTPITASLLSPAGAKIGAVSVEPAGTTDAAGPAPGWRKFSATLVVTGPSTAEAVFELAVPGAGTVNFDAVSLIPGDAV